MKKIPVHSQVRGVVYALIDDDDFNLVCGYAWHTRKKDKYATTTVYYYSVDGERRRKQVRMHHAIIGLPPIGMDVHHINGEPLDNRKSNLMFIDSLEHAYLTNIRWEREDYSDE
jgi:HNH endonuclease